MNHEEIRKALAERDCDIVEDGGRFALVYPHGYEARKKAHDLLSSTRAAATVEAWIWLHPERRTDAGIPTVQNLVAADFGFTVEMLLVRDRSEPLATARRIAMALCREITGAGPEQVGASFDRERGSVIEAVQSVRDQRETDNAFAARVGSLRAACLAALHP